MIEINGVVLVNPIDRGADHRYIFALGAYGWTKVMIWADSLDSALDAAVDWCRDYAPGLLANEQRDEAYDDAVRSGLTHEEAWDAAHVNLTIAGNWGDTIRSDEWHIVAEDPSRSEVLAILGRIKP